MPPALSKTIRRGTPPDPVKDVLEPLADALGRLPAEDLKEAPVAVGKTQTEILEPPFDAALDNISFPKIRLGFPPAARRAPGSPAPSPVPSFSLSSTAEPEDRNSGRSPDTRSRASDGRAWPYAAA